MTLSSRNGEHHRYRLGALPAGILPYIKDRTYAFLAAGTATGFDGDTAPSPTCGTWYDDAKAQ